MVNPPGPGGTRCRGTPPLPYPRSAPLSLMVKPMPLPRKPIVTLADATAAWGVANEDLASYALDGSLTFSVVCNGVVVDTGEFVEIDGGRHEIPYGRDVLNGLADVHGTDVWSAINKGSTLLRWFKPEQPNRFIEIADGSPLVIKASDLVLRRIEALRFAKDNELPEPAVNGGRGPCGRLGKPPQHDWDGFWIRVCRRLHDDGIPETQAELVRDLSTWFSTAGNGRPDTSTIKKKISRLWQTLQA